MPIRKHITAIVMAIVLHQSAAAWAVGEGPCPSLTPPPRQETQESREQPPEAVNQQAPLVENIQPSPPDPSSKPEAADPETGFVDVLHGGISRGLLATADWLDSFFADGRVTEDQNQSYIRTRYDVFQEKGARTSYAPNVDLRLALPQLKRKTRLVISAEPDETPQNAPAPISSTSERIGTTEEQNITTALHYFYRSTVRESVTVKTGVRLSSGSPVLFIGPRYRGLVQFKVWDFRFIQEAVWRTDTGWQANTRFDLERRLPHALFFRASVNGNWMEDRNGYFYNVSCSLRQPLDLKHALDYEWINSFQTRPVGELVEVLFRIRYRQSFWRDWLFFEVAPQYRFPRDRDFDGTPGILFRFEMFFGQKA